MIPVNSTFAYDLTLSNVDPAEEEGNMQQFTIFQRFGMEHLEIFFKKASYCSGPTDVIVSFFACFDFVF